MSDDALPSLPGRDPAGHKGTHGRVAIVGGCDSESTIMLGAPLLAGRAALRSGVGLCELVMPRSLLPAALGALTSAVGRPLESFTHHPPTADALVVGPGLGVDNAARIMPLPRSSDAALVLDADALNAWAADPDLAPPNGAVLTPHPGEARRLGEALGIRMDLSAPKGRITACRELARRASGTVVLKGRGTVVSDGHRHWVCARGHPCLGTGGTGDVLAGLLGGLLAQRSAGGWALSAYDVVRIGVETHARAGERWAQTSAPAGLLAMELADLLPAALRPQQGRRSDPSG